MQETTTIKHQMAETINKENTVGNLIANWKFFSPKMAIVKKILTLNEKIGDEYFQSKYKDLLEKEGNVYNHEVVSKFEENLKNLSWHNRLYSQISKILFHDDNRKSGMSDEEFLSFSQKYISERIYNHLAMLSRSPHAEEEGSFSLREELTEELAENIGLGLYLTDKISSDLRAETEHVLYELAENFENWFVNEKKGRFSTVFGEVCSPEVLSRFSPNESPGSILVLDPDVKQGKTFSARK